MDGAGGKIVEVEDVTRNEFCRSGNAPLDEVPLDGVAEMFVSEPKPTRAAKQEWEIVRDASAQLINATLESLPVHPNYISNMQGPMMEFRQLDAQSVDVKIVHSFRAHFDSVSGKLENDPPTISLHTSSPAQKSEVTEVIQGSNEKNLVPVYSKMEELPRDAHKLGEEVDTITMETGDYGKGLVSLQWSPWKIDPAKITIGRRVAVGGFAEVFVGKYEGTVVAVKRLIDGDITALRSLLSEVSILAQLRHPNLVLFMGFSVAPQLCIISEFMQKGCLYGILRQQFGTPLDTRLQRVVAISVARGMAYLHSRTPPILHLDLKSPNILVDNNWRVKITDFGLSQMRFRTLVSHAGVGAGSPHWMAPEMLRCENLDEKADVYSYGVVLWEILTGRMPWEDLNPMQVVGAVGFRGRTLPVPEAGDPVLLELFKTCCQHDPINRPSFTNILEKFSTCYGRDTFSQQSCRALPSCGLSPSEDSVDKGGVLDTSNVVGSNEQNNVKGHIPIQETQPRIIEVLSSDSEKLASGTKMYQKMEPGDKSIQNVGMEDGTCLPSAENRHSGGVKEPLMPFSPFALQSSDPFEGSCADHQENTEDGGPTKAVPGQPEEVPQLSIDSYVESISVESRGRNVGEHASVGYLSTDPENDQASKSPFATYAMVPFEHDKADSLDILRSSTNESTMAAPYSFAERVPKSPGIASQQAEIAFPLETKEAPLLPCTSNSVAMLPNLRSIGLPISPFAQYASVPIEPVRTHSSDSSSQLSRTDEAVSCEWKIKVAEIDTSGAEQDFTADDSLDEAHDQFLDDPESTWEHHCSSDNLNECHVERNVAGPSAGCSGSFGTVSTARNFGLGESHKGPPSSSGCTIPPVIFTQEPSKAILSGVFNGKRKPTTRKKKSESLISRFRCIAGHVWRDSSSATESCRLEDDSENESDQCVTSNTSSFPN